MPGRIDDLLDQIMNAIYGREVRGSIHDAIEICYDDVTEGKTIAETAAENTTSVISSATAATSAASDAAAEASAAAGQARSVVNDCVQATNAAIAATSDADTALENIATAIENANTATASATTAAADATNAIASATSAATLASSAASSASGAATSATNAAASAANAAADARAAESSATTAASNANTKASLAATAANNAEAAIAAAQIATTNANTARDAANTATTNANAARDAANTATANANTARDAANAAASLATTATNTANSRISDMNARLSEANTAISDANTATTNANAARDAANTATNRANSAAAAIESVTASSFDLPYTASASVTIQTDPGDGHKNFYFGLRQGNPGPGFMIKGDAYDTLSDLETDISNPDIGDCYNVGLDAPYHIYRWTGTVWEDQGLLVNSLVAITPEEVAFIQNGGTITPEPNKALGVSGLTYMLTTLEQNLLNTKVDKVTGKGLSTNDFTTAYKDAVDALQTDVSALQSGKVDKVTGKGLSTNDFTDAYKNKLDGIASGATAITVDAAMSSSSTNPVQNQIIYAALSAKQARHKTASVTVQASAWNSNHQATVSMSDVTQNNDIDVRPGPLSYDDWVNAGIRCTAQADGSITLTARTNPTVDVTVQALIWD